MDRAAIVAHRRNGEEASSEMSSNSQMEKTCLALWGALHWINHSYSKIEKRTANPIMRSGLPSDEDCSNGFPAKRRSTFGLCCLQQLVYVHSVGALSS